MRGEDIEAMMAFLEVISLLRKVMLVDLMRGEEVTGLLRKEVMVGDLMRGEEAMAPVVAGVAAITMERLLRVSGLEGHMTVTVRLEEGLNLSVMELAVETGELQLMKMFRKLIKLLPMKMTLEEYQKVLEEKRKSLLAEMVEERKVEVDKELKAMQQLSNKKANDEIFIKLGSEKDKRKDGLDKEEKAKKILSINEFLKPADGGSYNEGRGGRRGPRGGGGLGGGGGGGYRRGNAVVPKIEDPGQFPSLAGK